MSQHDTLLAAFETYKAENEKFIEKGIKASAARARKALQEIAAVKLSDIYESNAQIVQSAEGKLYVKATLLDEYLMEIETVEEAKIILEEFEQLWS